MMDEFQDELIKEYLLDAKEHIETIENLVVTLEREKELKKHEIDQLFRAYHTIKGNSALVNLNDIRDLSHIVESIVGEIRSGSLKMTPEIADIILNSVDMIKKMVTEIAENGKPVSDPRGLIDYIKKFREEYKSVLGAKPETSTTEKRRQVKMNVKVTPTVAIFDIPDNFSISERPGFNAALREYQQRGISKFIFNFAHVTTITNDGIKTIEGALKEIGSQGGKLASCDLSLDVMFSFNNLGVTNDINIQPSLKEAYATIK